MRLNRVTEKVYGNGAYDFEAMVMDVNNHFNNLQVSWARQLGELDKILPE